MWARLPEVREHFKGCAVFNQCTKAEPKRVSDSPRELLLPRGATNFELIDATVGEVGGRLHLSWRLRIRPAPFGIGDGWHIIEQQAYADAGDVIDAIDLLCSGFTPEDHRVET